MLPTEKGKQGLLTLTGSQTVVPEEETHKKSCEPRIPAHCLSAQICNDKGHLGAKPPNWYRSVQKVSEQVFRGHIMCFVVPEEETQKNVM